MRIPSRSPALAVPLAIAVCAGACQTGDPSDAEGDLQSQAWRQRIAALKQRQEALPAPPALEAVARTATADEKSRQALAEHMRVIAGVAAERQILADVARAASAPTDRRSTGAGGPNAARIHELLGSLDTRLQAREQAQRGSPPTSAR